MGVGRNPIGEMGVGCSPTETLKCERKRALQADGASVSPPAGESALRLRDGDGCGAQPDWRHEP